MNDREQRGMVIAATCQLKRKPANVWIVPSQSGGGNYTVVPHAENPYCNCPDHETRNCKCKHIYAVEFAMRREENPDGSITEINQVLLTEKRTTYPQNWPAYNAAQSVEKGTFRVLLHNLCKGIIEPRHTVGRPRLSLQDGIFAACYKVYSTVSGRRFMTDLREAQEEGTVRHAPCYNSIFKVLECPDTYPVLQSLVSVSAAPLKALESNFACDSSGFSGCRFDRWYDEKWGPNGKQKCERAWVKAHLMCGTRTNVVTALEVLEQNSGDSPEFRPLLATTAQRFDIKQVAADLAYSSRANVAAVDALGAYPLIPFKSNAVAGQPGTLWEKLFLYVQLHREEFLSRFHCRSNVESTFSMIKRKFGDSVRSKTDTAMRNEVAAKVVCHNICCLIQEMHENGVDPTFWGKN
jgi:hypothetical protein